VAPLAEAKLDGHNKHDHTDGPCHGGVDTHNNTHHAAVVDEVGRLLDTREIPADTPITTSCWAGWSPAAASPGLGSRAGTGCYGALV
jgi:transposase